MVGVAETAGQDEENGVAEGESGGSEGQGQTEGETGEAGGEVEYS